MSLADGVSPSACAQEVTYCVCLLLRTTTAFNLRRHSSEGQAFTNHRVVRSSCRAYDLSSITMENILISVSNWVVLGRFYIDRPVRMSSTKDAHQASRTPEAVEKRDSVSTLRLSGHFASICMTAPLLDWRSHGHFWSVSNMQIPATLVNVSHVPFPTNTLSILNFLPVSVTNGVV